MDVKNEWDRICMLIHESANILTERNNENENINTEEKTEEKTEEIVFC